MPVHGRLLDRPVDPVDDGRDVRLLEGAYREILPGDVDELAVLQVDDVAGPAHERGRVAGEEVLVVADAEDERRRLARRHDLPGMLGAQRGDAVRALDVVERLAHAFKEGALAVGLRPHLGIVVGDQVAQDLRVGLGLEGVVFRDEEGLDLAVVLDDAVVDQSELAVAAQMGMGVRLGDGPVRGPPGVPDSRRPAQAKLGRLLRQPFHPARPPDHRQGAALGDGDPGGVISPVLEALQGFDEDGRRLAVSDVADDAAHGCWWLGGGAVSDLVSRSSRPR